MKRRRLLRAIAGTSALAATAGCAALDDAVGDPFDGRNADCDAYDPTVDPASGWRVVNGDPAGTGVVTADAAPAASPSLQWTFPVDGHMGTSRPIVGDDYVYTVDLDAHVYAVDPETGDAAWTRDDLDGVHGTPALATDHLVVATDGALLGLDPATGDTAWRTETGRRSLFDGSPVVRDDVAYAPGGLSMTAVDATDGTRLFEHTTGLPATTTPAVTADAVYYGDDDTYVYALHPTTGDVHWRAKTDASLDGNLAATPDAVHATTHDGTVHALARDGGDHRWTRPLDAEVEHLAADGARVYVGTSDRLHALQPESGDNCWTARGYTGSYDSGVAVADGTVYAPHGDATSSDLAVYDAATGTRRTLLSPGDDDRRISLDTSPTLADGAIYATGRADATLALLKLA